MEDSKEKPSSGVPAAPAQKVPPAATQAPPAPAAPSPPAATRPAVAAPRPAPAPAASPPAAQQGPKSTSRRTFVKIMAAAGAVLSITPFIPWGGYLTNTARARAASTLQKVVIDNNPKYGAAAGKVVNVKDLTTFPPDSHWVITYPSSGDATLDAQNPDTFVKFELIRLPAGELGGDQKSAAAFVAFSKVCVHLWCSPNFNPLAGHQDYECPCHGSIYQLPVKDALGNLVDGGKAVEGPASLQPAPTNAIPMLAMQEDAHGNLIVDPTKNQFQDVDKNGIIGYGRNYQSYQYYILKVAAGSS